MVTYLCVIVLVIFFCYLAQRCCSTAILENGTYTIRKSRDCKFFLFWACAVLIFTAGCRYRVGTDYVAYMKLFESYAKTSVHDILMSEEPMLPLIGHICAWFYHSYKGLFFVASLLTVGLALRSTYHETTDFTFVTLMYIFAGCWHASFNGVRQYLACTIIFIGRHYITERKFLKYLLVCLLAFLCHRAAAIGIFLYFIYSRKISVKRFLIVFVAAIAVSISFEWVFDLIGWINNTEFVMNSYAATSVNVLRIAVGCCPAILGIYCSLTRKLDERQIFYVYMMIANAALRIATSGSAYLARFGMFTGVFVPLGLSYILDSCSENMKIQHYKIIRFVILILYLFFWLYEITTSRNLSNFQWFFGK